MKRIALMLVMVISYVGAYAAPIKDLSSREVNGVVFTDEELLNDEAILKFVSDPVVVSHFHEAMKQWLSSIAEVIPMLEAVVESFQDDEEYEDYKEWISYTHEFFADLKDHEEVDRLFIPWMTCGVFDRSQIKDKEAAALFSQFQVKLFKQWLSEYEIGNGRSSTSLSDLEEFLNSFPSEPLFHQMVVRLSGLREVLESDAWEMEPDDIMCHFGIDDTWDYYYDPAEDIDEELDPIDQALEDLNDPVDETVEKYFSRNAVIELFLKVTR